MEVSVPANSMWHQRTEDWTKLSRDQFWRLLIGSNHHIREVCFRSLTTNSLDGVFWNWLDARDPQQCSFWQGNSLFIPWFHLWGSYFHFSDWPSKSFRSWCEQEHVDLYFDGFQPSGYWTCSCWGREKPWTQHWTGSTATGRTSVLFQLYTWHVLEPAHADRQVRLIVSCNRLHFHWNELTKQRNVNVLC